MPRFALAAVLALTSARAGGSAPQPGDVLRQLRFSPDGRYVLAQDDSQVTVLTVQPFAVLMRIPAAKATAAQFVPDSRQVVFVNSAAHVERWSVTDRARVDLTKAPVQACGTERLSPDGDAMACVDTEGTLTLVDVVSGRTILEEKRFGRQFIQVVEAGPTDFTVPGHIDPDRSAVLPLDPGTARMSFSPDGRFFVATPEHADGRALAWHLHSGGPVRLKGELKLFGWGGTFGRGTPDSGMFFAFVAPDRLLITTLPFPLSNDTVTASLVAFPSGRVLSRPKIPPGQVFRAADPGFALIRPFGRATDSSPNTKRAAAVELSTGRVIVSENPALDVLGRYYIAEPSPGIVGFYERGKGLQATVAIHEK